MKFFGEDDKTCLFEVKEPLTFEVRDFSTKAGHMVDVVVSDPAQTAQIAVTAYFICQTLRLKSFPRLQPFFDGVDRDISYPGR